MAPKEEGLLVLDMFVEQGLDNSRAMYSYTQFSESILLNYDYFYVDDLKTEFVFADYVIVLCLNRRIVHIECLPRFEVDFGVYFQQQVFDL